jgi:hypothetical protein
MGCSLLRHRAFSSVVGWVSPLFRELEERLAALTGGVAVIRVGAASEAELKSRKEVFEDAISATKAPMAEGILPGGGLALLRAIEAVVAEEGKTEGDQRTGVQILRRRSRHGPDRSRRTPRRMAASWWTGCEAARATSGTMPQPAATSTSSRQASSTRRRSCGSPLRTPSQ